MKNPTCHRCRIALVRREHPTKLAAELGTWYDHPPMPSLIGHDVSALCGVVAASRITRSTTAVNPLAGTQ